MKDPLAELPSEIAKQIDPAWRKTKQNTGRCESGFFVVTRTNGSALRTAGWWRRELARSRYCMPPRTRRAALLWFGVGREADPCRMRRSTFNYDSGIPASRCRSFREFRPVRGTPGISLTNVIADTGADASALPWADCQQLQLGAALGRPAWMGGMAGASAATLVFRIWAQMDGQEYPCRSQADFIGKERILGRDVLNRLELLFRGPAAELIVNP